MSNKVERGPYNASGAPPKYINDFSKALASEVRILLDEVGKLRDERRALQYEIAELMSVKSKHGAGGEFTPDWAPKHEAPPPLMPELPPPAIEDSGSLQPAKPAWRTVHKRPDRKRKQITAATPAPPLAPQLASPPVKPETPSWAQWRPDHLVSPVPRQATPSMPPPREVVPPRMGLFGPPSPPLK
ncbi:hypothetical protein BDM02DRAFT_3109229 [Thelephora ganbajun]|uniref:Uncharacterized protein n=1 Tax=Thelephora ganbajun TaxID=370292 RepID=A0ACB6ZS30_THEGA|nr:hypothetical protein BDM02DRAFT_3109229 [Thelephora ganbajun]